MYKYGFTTSKKLTPKLKVPSILAAYFLIIQVLFGLNCGFCKLLKKRYRLVLKSLSIFVSLTLILLLFLSLIPFDFTRVWLLFTFAQYTTYFIVCQTTKYTILDFMTDTNNAFRKIPVFYTNTVGLVVVGHGTTALVIKCVNLYAACELLDFDACGGKFQSYQLYTYLIAVMCVDLSFLVQVLIFYYLYQCLRFINTLPLDHQVIQEKYVAVAVIFDKIMPLYDKLKTIELIGELPKFLGTLWYHLASFKQNGSLELFGREASWLYYASERVYLITTVVYVVAPAVLAEMIKANQAALTLRLHQALLEERDSCTSAALSRLLQYMSCRRLQHYTWGVLPMDMRLPLALFNLSTTYFVVILQFTHLYD